MTPMPVSPVYRKAYGTPRATKPGGHASGIGRLGARLERDWWEGGEHVRRERRDHAEDAEKENGIEIKDRGIQNKGLELAFKFESKCPARLVLDSNPRHIVVHVACHLLRDLPRECVKLCP